MAKTQNSSRRNKIPIKMMFIQIKDRNFKKIYFASGKRLTLGCTQMLSFSARSSVNNDV